MSLLAFFRFADKSSALADILAKSVDIYQIDYYPLNPAKDTRKLHIIVVNGHSVIYLLVKRHIGYGLAMAPFFIMSVQIYWFSVKSQMSVLFGSS